MASSKRLGHPGDLDQELLAAINSPVRREILWRLWDGELTVAQIAAGFDLSAPTISNHLSVLRRAGLVDVRPEGTTRWYSARHDAVGRLRQALPDDPDKWHASTDHPEQQLPASVVQRIIAVSVDAPCSVDDAFRAFTSAELYSRWLGAPVQLVDGRFSAQMEFGTIVRGTYDLVCAPSLIVMTWDFQHDAVPTPGGGLRAQLVLSPVDEHTCRLDLHQFVTDEAQAGYMDRAWRLVLGRFTEHVLGALDTSRPMARRPRRPRRPTV